MAGLASTATIRQQQQKKPAEEAQDVDLAQTVVADGSKPIVVVDFPDGSVTINLASASGAPAKPLSKTKFDENLCDAIGAQMLATLADDLLEGIEEDDRSRQDWIEDRAEGIRLLALQREKPSSSVAGSGADNTSKTRHTMLLEAALRFQANAQGEMLPTDGPVKVEAKMDQDTAISDDLAQALQDDLNYYFQTTASEYYPDTERMMFWAAVGGCGIKKVYRCPVRRRPVSESVDARDLIVSNNATDLQNADRVTFRVLMRQGTMKRLQRLKVYRDVALGTPIAPTKNAVDEEKEAVTGVTVNTHLDRDIPFEVLECYCNIDVPGDEHQENGEITGIPRPYKVSIEKGTRTVLEVRRNWREDDALERPRETFVKFPFVPGFGFYDLGLVHIMGNPTVAATALLRIMIDAGIYGNFPGGLIGKAGGKQNTTDINVPPGSFADIDTSSAPDGDIRKVVMPLPYKSPDSAMFELLKEVVTTGSRVGGAADIQVGEGKQDAPVGTTIALIEQATKVTDAVHKRMHASQAKEIELVRNLFREYPEDFWKFNQERDKYWDKEKLLKALNDYNLLPRSDPNTSSQLQRIMRAQALYQIAKNDPAHFKVMAIYEMLLRVLKIANPEAFLQQDTGAPPPDPAVLAKQAQAEADQTKAQAALLDATTRAKNLPVDNENKDADRKADLQIESMRLKTEQVIHGQDQDLAARSQLSKQAHETGLAAVKTQAENQRSAAEIAAAHIQQAADHEHELNIPAQSPAAPKPKGDKES